MVISELEQIAVDAALEAGRILCAGLGHKRRVRTKKGLELVSDADLKIQQLITARLKPTWIPVVAEEGGEGLLDSCWLVDPIDGTTNYIHGLPIFAISIGLLVDREIQLGIVHAPYLGETFTALRGEGARLNGKPITVSKTESLSDALLATGFPYDLLTSPNNNFDHFYNFSQKARAIRRMGCASLDLAYVACGRLDGFWELKLKPWDTAAGALLVSEAGGLVTDFSGGKFQLDRDEILAANPTLHPEMVEVLTGK
ncbi:inositol monophosphatase [candidate division WOR-3 bacterium]|uniref:Inositol-1-monophosphatase n=1 Tax=candidate division WOR-3 bacterium TaxID=2052148 RepID=A0A660SJE9_UNCW3|nr:MAG: inositol monophosphatase [candidate division WOR-3 bacterium]